ncbi:MAG: PQQ-dependent sugar dehydrogenase [Akkermansiaceae bacterium]
MMVYRLTYFIFLFSILVSSAHAAPVDSNFAVDVIQTGDGKTKIAFDSAGRMYVTEKKGRLLLFEPNGSGGFQVPSVLLDITANVDSGLEAGLLGFEVDPNHASNRFIYLFYTTPEQELWDGTGDQRLVRYTMNTTFTGIESGSETILLSGLPRIINFHKAGDIAIHPLDPFAIVIALGDDDQVGNGGILPQDLDSYVGKILRVDSSTGLGLADNPHYNGDPNSVRSRVWASGMRNPFRFAFHPDRADMLYISENGDSTDRVAMVKAGGNGQWNGNDNGGFLAVDTPLFKVLHTTSPSLVGVEIVTSGPFAHNGQPTLYLGNWLDGTSRFTLSDSTDAQDNEWDTMTAIPAGGASYWDSAATAMDLHLAADGHLYFTQTNGNASTGGWYPLRRFRYAGGTPPSASFSTSPSSGTGEAPFLVSFSDTSTAGTNTLSAWHWDFGDGNTSSVQNPTHTYTAPGSYAPTLTVTDSVGLTSSSQVQLAATASTSVSLSLDVLDGRSLPAIPVTSTFTISFFQTDGVTPLAFSGGTGSEGNQLVTLADGTYNGTLNLPLIAPGFIMVVENTNPLGFQNVTRGASVTLGQSNTIDETFYVSSATLSGRVLSLRGNPAMVDVGVRSAGQPVNFAGARDYLSDSDIPVTGIAHRVSTDDLGYFSIPLPVAQVGATMELTFSEDTGRGTYATGIRTILSQADVNLDASYSISEWRGGLADDLSGQAYTANVNYTNIQGIFNANCTGCHRANTTNNGGLDLTSGNSYAELVNQMSLFAPGLKLVDPGSPSRSYLFEKINSPSPQQGNRMRPSDALPLADQALIRDWISQLSPGYENFVWTTFGSAPGSANTGIADDFNGNGIANGLEHTDPQMSGLGVSPSGSSFQGALQFNANSTGLTMFIQASDDLQPGQWRTVASRLRGQSAWRSAVDFSINTATPGVLQFTDSTSAADKQFYRFGVSEE